MMHTINFEIDSQLFVSVRFHECPHNRRPQFYVNLCRLTCCKHANCPKDGFQPGTQDCAAWFVLVVFAVLVVFVVLVVLVVLAVLVVLGL